MNSTRPHTSCEERHVLQPRFNCEVTGEVAGLSSAMNAEVEPLE